MTSQEWRMYVQRIWELTNTGELSKKERDMFKAVISRGELTARKIAAKEAGK